MMATDIRSEIKLLLAVVIALVPPLVGESETPLTEAKITWIVRDVKTIDPLNGAHPAVLKETLRGQQSVRTGMQSRTELLFNDKSITRLGANTHFNFLEGTRNMFLESGVMLLQVPKGNGGANITTQAVVAGVTGTTIMIEAGWLYTKLIVLEGECCLWSKTDKLKVHHKVCVEAGQEIIMRNGSNNIPDPVYVNLKLLENTSLLINGEWGVNLDNGPIIFAANSQGPAEYSPFNLAATGAGADNVITFGKLPQNPPGLSTPPPVAAPTAHPSPRTPPSIRPFNPSSFVP